MNLGRWGEEAAAKYLKTKGYQIIERNFRCRAGEIDLIAMDGKILVFIEVKSRRSVVYGLPCEAITPVKKRHMAKAVAYYNLTHGICDREMRADSVEILIMGGSAYVRHMKDIL